jgi:hypothetical protein
MVRTTISILFGTLEKSATTISFILSVVSFILTVLALRFPETIPPIIIIRDISIVFSLIGVALILLYRYATKEWTIRNQAQRMIEVYDRDYHIVHEYRNTIFSYFIKKGIPQEFAFDPTHEEMKLFEKVCLYTTTMIRDTFKEYFKSRGIDIGEDISVSVKLAIPSTKVLEEFRSQDIESHKKEEILAQDRWIVTVFRDPYTFVHHREEREVGGLSLYTVKGNTAFHQIAEGKRKYFFNNDLNGLGDAYDNENQSWREHYNSTLVVPIRYLDNVSGQQQQWFFGFLAIDSKNPDKLKLYNKHETKFIMSHAADLLATFFLTLAVLKFNMTSQEKPNGDRIAQNPQ